MDNLDRAMIVLLILTTSSCSGMISYTGSKEFTCKQFNKIYLLGECVALAKE